MISHRKCSAPIYGAMLLDLRDPLSPLSGSLMPVFLPHPQFPLATQTPTAHDISIQGLKSLKRESIVCQLAKGRVDTEPGGSLCMAPTSHGLR